MKLKAKMIRTNGIKKDEYPNPGREEQKYRLLQSHPIMNLLDFR